MTSVILDFFFSGAVDFFFLRPGNHDGRWYMGTSNHRSILWASEQSRARELS
jgi:hypothetical protein